MKRKSFSTSARAKYLTDAVTGAVIRCSKPDCGCPAEHIHHKIAVCEGGSDDPSNLEMLCQIHHVAIHSGNGDFKTWGAIGGRKTGRSGKSLKNLKQFKGSQGEKNLQVFFSKKFDTEMGIE